MTARTRLASGALAALLLAGGAIVGLWNYTRPAQPTPTINTTVEQAPPAIQQEVALPSLATPETRTVIGCSDRKYTVIKGDSLWKIADAEYGGRAYLWQLIAEKNELRTPDLIHPEQVLTIPDCISSLPARPKVVPTSASTTRTNTPARKPLPETKPATTTATAPPTPHLPAAQAREEEPKVEVPAPQPETAVVQPVAVTMLQEEPQAEIKPEVKDVEAVSSPSSLEVAPATLKIGTVPHPLLLPGAFWNSLGTYPIEKENVVNQLHIEQGIAIGHFAGFSLEPYVSGDIIQDSKKLPWDNRARAFAGGRFRRPLRNGVVDLNLGFLVEQRQTVTDSPKVTRSGFMLSNNGWFGWNQPSPSSSPGFLGNTPGTAWWIVGNVSPFEKGNIIGLARGEQGVTVTKAGSVHLIPLGWVQAGFDTKKYTWNNRFTLGGGMKVAVPWRTGVISVQGGYECTEHWRGTLPSRCGLTIRTDIWTGWLKIGGNR